MTKKWSPFFVFLQIQCSLTYSFLSRLTKICPGSIPFLLSNWDCSLQLNNAAIIHTVTDHHVFHISSEFDTDLFYHSLSCRGNKKNNKKTTVSICCAKLSLANIVFLLQFKIPQTSQLFCTGLSILCTSSYISLLTVTVVWFSRLALVLTHTEKPLGREGTALYSYINCKAQVFTVPICGGIPINNL